MENFEQQGGEAVEGQMKEAQEIVKNKESDTNGFSMKQGNTSLEAMVLASVIGVTGGTALTAGSMSIIDYGALNRNGELQLAQPAAKAVKSLKDTVKRFEAQHSYNKHISPAMKKGLHAYFPDLDISEIKFASKVAVDGGFTYDFTRNESGEFSNPISPIGIDEIRHDLTKAFEHDDGSIDFYNGEGGVLRFNGFTGSPHSVPGAQ